MAAAWTPEDLKTKLDAGERVFLKLWQKGCGPCRLSEPAVERLEKANKHDLSFGQISVDDHPEMAEMAGAEILPVFFVFTDKKMKGKFLGFKGLAKLEEFVADSVNQS